jgi:methionyl-tRNA formyltransferase
MRIIFFGTPSFAVPSLEALIQSGEEVTAVVTQPDKRKGRDRLLSPPLVKELAKEKGIRISQPVSIKNNQLFFDELRGMNPELIVVVAYGKILPAQILKLPEYGCMNVHASLLPKYRGAAPVQWAILKGEKSTGVTTMLMDEGLDTGDILLQRETDIVDEDTAETLGRKLSEMGARLLSETIQGIKGGLLKPMPQTGTPSYAPPLKKEDGRIRWASPAAEIVNCVRGMYPWPCAYCYLNNERIKIIKARAHAGHGTAGRIERAEEDLVIGTADGLLSILELQPEGKRVMTVKEFLQGRRLKEGSFFDE